MQSGPDTIALIMPSPEVDPHGTLRLGVQTYRAAFEEIGYRTRVFDLSGLDHAMVDALRSERIRAVFSDGGWIHNAFIETADGRVSLGDRIAKPLIVLINDSPCSYWMGPILERDRQSQTTAFLDADFPTFWSRWADKAGTHQTYIPACPPLTPEGAEGDGSIGILAVVSLREPEFYRDYIRTRFADGRVHRLFDGIVDAGLFDSVTPFSAVCDGVCRSLGIGLNYTDVNDRVLVFAADYFIRNRRRAIMIDRLSAHPITLVGGGPGPRLHPDTRVVPPVPHAQLLDLYRRARAVIVSPPYSGGVTERMVHPMAAGALVVAPPTGLSDRLFGRDRLFVTARTDFSDLDACLDRAMDSALHRTMTDEARAYTAQRLSPAATVRRFLGEPDAPELTGFPPA